VPNTPVPERCLTILKYSGKTPALALCDRCHLKFFTPKELFREPMEAEGNLREKFEMHDCKVTLRRDLG